MRKMLGSLLGSLSGTRQTEAMERAKKEFLEHYARADRATSSILSEAFPEAYRTFEKPSPEDMFEGYVSKRTAKSRERSLWGTFQNPLKEAQRLDVLMTRSFIRYLDNFLDNALWPKLHEGDPKQLRDVVERVLKNIVEILNQEGAVFCDENLALWRLELDLELALPEEVQRLFNAKAVDLLKYKSFDVAYVRSLASSAPDQVRARLRSGRSLVDLNDENYLGLCIYDFLRDFNEGNYNTETDLNLRNYLLSRKLDPQVLIDFLRNLKTKSEERRKARVFGETAVGVQVGELCDRMIEKLEEVKNVQRR